jgi:hypothetical protein
MALSAARLSNWQLHVQSAPGAPSKLFYFNETVPQTASNFFVASAQDNADGAQNRKSVLKLSLAAPVWSWIGETDLTHIITRTKRIGFLALIATVQIACIGGDAFAQTVKVRDRNLAANARAGEPVKSAGLGPTGLGQMRYYGGPKSPMSRGPVQN